MPEDTPHTDPEVPTAVPPGGQVLLRFRKDVMPPGQEDVHLDISALAREGTTLFAACDETVGVERLQLEDFGDPDCRIWSRHRHFRIGDLVEDLPDGCKGEMDIEGLSIDGGWLWLTGSHSLKRKDPARPEPDKLFDKIRKTGFDANRQFLGRVPLRATSGGLTPVGRDGDRRARHLKFTKGGKLRDWLEKDKLLKEHLKIPSKENGLDIEGIAVQGLRVWLGLRGR